MGFVAIGAGWGALLMGGCVRLNPAAPPLTECSEGVTEPATVWEALSGPLSESEAVSRALLRDGSIVALAGQDVVERLRQAESSAPRAPQLRYRTGRGESESEALGYLTSRGVSESTGVGLRIYPRNPWSVRATGLQFEAQQHRVSAEMREAMHQLQVSIRRLFLEIETGEAMLALQDEQLRVSDRFRAVARQRIAAGLDTLTESIDASGDYLRLLSRRTAMQQTLADARASLARRVGCTPDSLSLAAAIEVPPDSAWNALDAATLTEAALSRRGAYQRLVWARVAQRYAVSAARWERLPWFAHLQASYAWATRDDRDMPNPDDPGLVSPLETTDGEEWRVDAAVSLPLHAWWGSTVALRKEALALGLQREQLFRVHLEGDVTTALARVRESYQAWQRYLTDALPARESLTQALATLRSRETVEEGDVMAAELALLCAAQEIEGLRLRYANCVLDLEALVGQPLDSPAPASVAEPKP